MLEFLRRGSDTVAGGGLAARLLKAGGVRLITEHPPMPPPPPKRLSLSSEELSALVPKKLEREIAQLRRDREQAGGPQRTRERRADTEQVPRRRQSANGRERDERPEVLVKGESRLSDKLHAAILELVASGKLRDPALLASGFDVTRVEVNFARTKAIAHWRIHSEDDWTLSCERTLERHKKAIEFNLNRRLNIRPPLILVFELETRQPSAG